jgi:hypothetical protein
MFFNCNFFTRSEFSRFFVLNVPYFLKNHAELKFNIETVSWLFDIDLFEENSILFFKIRKIPEYNAEIFQLNPCLLVSEILNFT